MSFSISSRGWSELNGGKFRCKAARVFIFGPTILSCIKWGRVCYKSISPSGDLLIFMGYFFTERVIGWRQWFLLWGICQCLPATYDSPVPNKIALGELCLELVCLYRSVWISMWYLCQLQSRLPLYYSQSYYEEPTGSEYMKYPPGAFIHCMNWWYHYNLICQISTVYEMYWYDGRQRCHLLLQMILYTFLCDIAAA